MDITASRSNGTLTLKLAGRLDMNTAPLLAAQLALDGVASLVLDLNDCPYISSGGLREILRAQKELAKTKGTMLVSNVSPEVFSILEVTGLARLISIRRKVRQISIEGLEFISAGVCGECYRLDPETIVKLYNEGIEADVAEREKAYAKAAFVLGIPTAISYDVVGSGNRTGVVYEMLDAQLFSAVIGNDLENIDQHARALAGVARTIHATTAEASVFPDIKQRFRGYLQEMDFFLSAAEIAFLQAKLESIPDAGTCVHFDIHTSNIMIKDGEPVIIDMGDFSTGSYLFDVGLMQTIYGYPEINLCQMVTKIPDEKGVELLDRFLHHYFADKPAAEYEFFLRNRDFLGSLRLIYTITFLPKMREQLAGVVKDLLLPRMLAA